MKSARVFHIGEWYGCVFVNFLSVQNFPADGIKYSFSENAMKCAL